MSSKAWIIDWTGRVRKICKRRVKIDEQLTKLLDRRRERLGGIFLGLSHDQLESIQDQLTYMLEHMHQKGYLLSEQHPDFLQYDRENDKVYLVDLTFMMYADPTASYSKPITRDSVWVLAFNVWREELKRLYSKTEDSPQYPIKEKRSEVLVWWQRYLPTVL